MRWSVHVSYQHDGVTVRRWARRAMSGWTTTSDHDERTVMRSLEQADEAAQHLGRTHLRADVTLIREEP